MKFFTPELYVRFNSTVASVANRADADWDRALAAYRKHLRSIRLKLPASVASLASNTCLHDAEYLGFSKMTMPAMTADVAMIAVRKDGAVNFLVYVLVVGEPMVTRPLEFDVFDVSQPHWLYDEIDGEIVKCCGRVGESGGDLGEDLAVLELGVFSDFDQ